MNSASSPSFPTPLSPIPWQNERVSRIILGTVQLGMDYGVANALGKPDSTAALRIVESAWSHGIRCFDTAQAYGDSEAVLGAALSALGLAGEACIASKLSPQLDPTDLGQVAASIEKTLARLQVPSLWCMMLHTASWLRYWDKGLGGILRQYRDEGRIKHLGVSLNSPAEAEQCLSIGDMEILQVACNAWDRRMIRLGVMKRAEKTDRLCCVRSIYLKGLLALSCEEVASRMTFAREASLRWHAIAARHNLPPVELAVRFALGLHAPLVVGAETPGQIADTVRIAARGPLDTDVVEEIARELDPVLNDTILTPRAWEDLSDVRLSPARDCKSL